MMMVELSEIAGLLNAGRIVCVPTETTYGLAADARSAAAVDAVAALKGRDETSPIAVIAADLEQARSIAAVWPEAAAALAARHWPGPLTLVIPAAGDLPARLVGPRGVGVRVSSHPWCSELAARLGRPITATSANPSGQSAATSVAIARGYFGDRVAAYLDGGPSSPEPLSTVVAVSAAGELEVLRAGAIGADQL
jgi:L-threonylcarbamoyladenylate synthase